MTLLSVCYSIRKVAVRIVYGENILDLILREDDLTPLARGSIEKISLNIKLCNTHLDEQVRRANVLAYIGKHLKSLRSLVVTVNDESDAFADFDARPQRHPLLITTIKKRHESREEFERMCLSAVNKLVERWNMRWLRALAEITGLLTFEFTLYTLVEISNDGWNVLEGFRQGPLAMQEILRGCLEDRVCQPRQEVTVVQLPFAEEDGEIGSGKSSWQSPFVGQRGCHSVNDESLWR
ncbi:hypothetical protein ABVK25_009445 [Lepraria finkii]|uniref:Uncharacterized protein n=1 Tax=Lepraria finkii TaxID=1340010 RepID=A0ABR4AXE2_9LECA